MVALPLRPTCSSPMVIRVASAASIPERSSTAARRSPRCRGVRPVPGDVQRPRRPPWIAGAAGGSAQREFERPVARREATSEGSLRSPRRWRAAWPSPVRPQSTRAWARGSRGRTGACEGARGRGRHPHVLDDRRVPGHARQHRPHRHRACAGGIFVVDAKFSRRRHQGFVTWADSSAGLPALRGPA